MRFSDTTLRTILERVMATAMMRGRKQPVAEIVLARMKACQPVLGDVHQ
jgi:hypothetical protein